MNKALLPELTLRQQGTLPELLGVEIVSVDDHSLQAAFDIRPHHLAPNGYLHAASVVMLTLAMPAFESTVGVSFAQSKSSARSSAAVRACSLALG